jgi:hypothetical protein
VFSDIAAGYCDFTYTNTILKKYGTGHATRTGHKEMYTNFGRET